jgi:C4-dicarboxylate-specific signal transduction histidine kinase
MFLPFVSEGKESGVGLGLTVALQIAQEHGGTLEFEENVDDRGSAFTITLSKMALDALGVVADRKALQAS